MTINQPRWLNMTMDQVMQSTEIQREMAEYLAPKMQAYAPVIEQFKRDMQNVNSTYVLYEGCKEIENEDFWLA